MANTLAYYGPKLIEYVKSNTRTSLGACTINRITAVILSYRNKQECLPLPYIYPRLIFTGKARNLPEGTSGLPANIKLGCKWLTDEKSCLLPYRINYNRKKFYSTGPWTDSFVLIREKKYEKF